MIACICGGIVEVGALLSALAGSIVGSWVTNVILRRSHDRQHKGAKDGRKRRGKTPKNLVEPLSQYLVERRLWEATCSRCSKTEFLESSRIASAEQLVNRKWQVDREGPICPACVESDHG